MDLIEDNADTSTLVVDPQFVNYQPDGTGDYHLQNTSPAIDAGTSIGAPTTDLDGNPRPQGDGFDIGLYESKVSRALPNLATSAMAVLHISKLAVFLFILGIVFIAGLILWISRKYGFFFFPKK